MPTSRRRPTTRYEVTAADLIRSTPVDLYWAVGVNVPAANQLEMQLESLHWPPDAKPAPGAIVTEPNYINRPNMAQVRRGGLTWAATEVACDAAGTILFTFDPAYVAAPGDTVDTGPDLQELFSSAGDERQIPVRSIAI